MFAVEAFIVHVEHSRHRCRKMERACWRHGVRMLSRVISKEHSQEVSHNEMIAIINDCKVIDRNAIRWPWH